MLRKLTGRLKRIAGSVRRVAQPPEPTPTPTEDRLPKFVTLARTKAIQSLLATLANTDKRAIYLNCHHVERVDASGVALLLRFAMQCRARGVALYFVAPTARVWDAFTLYGLKDFLIEHSDLREAPSVGARVIVEHETDAPITLDALNIEEPEFPDSIRLPAVRTPAA